MAPKYALVYWTKTKKISVVLELSFVKTFEENGAEIPVSEGTVRMVTVGEKQLEARVLRICASKKYLESLVVTKDGEILLHGAKPPSIEHLAKKSNLPVNDVEENTEHNASGADKHDLGERSPRLGCSSNRSSSDCSHGCPSCCSGTLPPFPELPDGFVSTLVSLAEYFQQFQKVTAEKVTPETQVQSSMSKNLNTWQWASREKLELKKGSGVWIDAMKLEKILGHADITKKPPHQTLVKSLLLDLLGTAKYIETTAEKIDRRLLSAVVGFTNEKYPEHAQPVERYYRCINLNRGYMQKRKNEGAFENDDSYEGTAKARRSDGMQYAKRQSGYDGRRRMRGRPRRSGTREALAPASDNILNDFDSSDQLIIPLEYDNEEDFSAPSNNDINKIIVVPSRGRTNSESTQRNALQTNSLSTVSAKGQRHTMDTSSAATEVYDVPSDDEDFLYSANEPQVKVEEYDYIEGALDID